MQLLVPKARGQGLTNGRYLCPHPRASQSYIAHAPTTAQPYTKLLHVHIVHDERKRAIACYRYGTEELKFTSTLTTRCGRPVAGASDACLHSALENIQSYGRRPGRELKRPHLSRTKRPNLYASYAQTFSRNHLACLKCLEMPCNHRNPAFTCSGFGFFPPLPAVSPSN